jgi:hypothetical protein
MAGPIQESSHEFQLGSIPEKEGAVVLFPGREPLDQTVQTAAVPLSWRETTDGRRKAPPDPPREKQMEASRMGASPRGIQMDERRFQYFLIACSGFTTWRNRVFAAALSSRDGPIEYPNSSSRPR